VDDFKIKLKLRGLFLKKKIEISFTFSLCSWFSMSWFW